MIVEVSVDGHESVLMFERNMAVPPCRKTSVVNLHRNS